MKKILFTAFIVTALAALMSAAVCAEAVPVAVTAYESWTNATYDPDNKVLKNIVIDNMGTPADTTDDVDRSYAFMWDPANPHVIQGSTYLYGPTYNDFGTNFPATATTVVFPSTITYDETTYQLTTIPQHALGGWQSSGGTGYKPKTIARIVVSEGYTALPNQFAARIDALRTVEIHGETVTSIGQDAFNGSNITTRLDLPVSLTSFSGSLAAKAPSNVTIPWRLKNIPNSFLTGQIGIANVYFKGTPLTLGNQIFRNPYSNGVKNAYFEGAAAPMMGNNLIQGNLNSNLTVHYPANRASYVGTDAVSSFENRFRIASGIFEDLDSDGVYTDRKSGTGSANLLFAKIKNTSSVINNAEFVKDEEDGDYYRVDYNMVISEADWAAYSSTAVAYVTLFDGDEVLVGAKKVSLTDTSSFAVFDANGINPTNAKLFVWANMSSVKPLIPAAELRVN